MASQQGRNRKQSADVKKCFTSIEKLLKCGSLDDHAQDHDDDDTGKNASPPYTWKVLVKIIKQKLKSLKTCGHDAEFLCMVDFDAHSSSMNDLLSSSSLDTHQGDGSTLLLIAIKNKHAPEVIKELMIKDNTDISDKNKVPPVLACALLNEIPAIQVLTLLNKMGANMNAMHPTEGWTILHHAICKNKEKMSEMLLSTQTVNHKQLHHISGFTALHLAAVHNNAKILNILVHKYPKFVYVKSSEQSGADLPLITAIKYRSDACVQLLLSLMSARDAGIKDAHNLQFIEKILVEATVDVKYLKQILQQWDMDSFLIKIYWNDQFYYVSLLGRMLMERELDPQNMDKMEVLIAQQKVDLSMMHNKKSRELILGEASVIAEQFRKSTTTEHIVRLTHLLNRMLKGGFTMDLKDIITIALQKPEIQQPLSDALGWHSIKLYRFGEIVNKNNITSIAHSTFRLRTVKKADLAQVVRVLEKFILPEAVCGVRGDTGPVANALYGIQYELMMRKEERKNPPAPLDCHGQ